MNHTSFIKQRFTRDSLTPITLGNIIYYPVDGEIRIPSTHGDFVITLVTENLLRKDWYYEIIFGDKRFIHVGYDDLVDALVVLTAQYNK